MQIGYASQNPTSHYWLLVSYGVRERASALGIELTTLPAYTLEQQIAAIYTFIEQRVDVLLLGPIIAHGLAGTIARVRAAGIPVIVLAAQLQDCAVDCTVRSDHRRGAELAAAYMVEQIGGAGEVAHLVGPSRLQDNIDRADGVRHVLAQHPAVRLAFEQESPDWEPASGAAFMREALERSPQLRGVCSANDTLAIGALGAIATAGRTSQIVVTGFDATPDALIAIHEGRMSATIRQSIRGIGSTAVEMAQRIVLEKTVPALVLTDISLVTRANLLETALEAVYLLPAVLGDVVERGEALARARETQALAERQHAATVLQESEERFRRLADAAFEGIAVLDAEKILEVNQNWLTMFGYAAGEAQGMDASAFITPASRALVRERLISGNEAPYEVQGMRKDGTRFPVEARGKTMHSRGRALRIAAVQDITARKQAEAERERLLAQVQRVLARTDLLYHTAQALIAASDLPQLLQTVVDHTAKALPADRVTVIIFDLATRQVREFVKGGPGSAAVQVVEFDEILAGLSGWAVREGRSARSSKARPDRRESVAVQRRRVETNCGAIMVALLQYHGKTLGTITAINRIADPNFSANDLALLEAIANQAAAAISNAQLVHDVQQLAVTDELTQLLNRRGFFTLGDREIARAQRQGEPVSAIMLDIDSFKGINDRYGHATGDQVLQQVAQRCVGGVREVDVLGRYGGEEFAVLLPNTPSAGAQIVAERLRAAIADTPMATIHGPIAVTVSLGVARVDNNTAELAALLQRADAALYTAKQTGRNRVVVAAAAGSE